jgi:hypothetical protein
MKTQMKQTTIQIYIEEEICGATVFATSRRTKFCQHTGSRANPLPEEETLWRMIAGESAQWGIGRIIEPKDGEFDNVTWFKNLSESIERVCKKRPYKTKVRALNLTPQGYPTRWSVTVFWDKPTPPPLKDTPGLWTLRQFEGAKRRGKVLCEFDGTLECCGDDLYCFLPDGCVPDGYDIFPDYMSVVVCQSLEEEVENPVWWEFTFKPRKRFKKGSVK